MHIIILNFTTFSKVKNIEEDNKELEKQIIDNKKLKEEVDLYNNLLDNANILEKDAKELNSEKEKLEKEISNLTLEVKNLEEKIKKIK